MSPKGVQIPAGWCQCGCGQRAPLSDRNHAPRGYVKGEPMQFIRGHHHRRNVEWAEEDRGYETPCWIWSGSCTSRGYGQLHRGKRGFLAHRLVYEMARGSIPDDLTLDHLCRVTACVNPDHLEPVTMKENLRRGSRVKLTPEIVACIRAASTPAWVEADRYGLTPSYVREIRRREVWV